MRYEIDIPGRAVPKGRPRMTRRGHAYTPKATRDYESLVVQSFLRRYRKGNPLTGAVTLTVCEHRVLPKGLSKRTIAEMDNTYCLKRPDLDNIVKSITDALNGFAYEDDSQIAEVYAVKKWTKGSPHIYVSVKEIEYGKLEF